MKQYFSLCRGITIATVVSLATIACSASTQRLTGRHYYIPNNYVGRVRILFDVPGAPPLPRGNGKPRVVNIPPSGLLETSSSSAEFHGIEFSPSCDGDGGIRFYYVNDDDAIVRHLPRGFCDSPEIHSRSMGIHGSTPTERFFVGTETDVESYSGRSCYGGLRQSDGTVIFPGYNEPTLYIPDQYVGWVHIVHSSGPDAYDFLDLPYTSDRVHHIPASGKLRLLSKSLWVDRLECGQQQLNFFYGSSGSQEARRLIENDMVWRIRTGIEIEENMSRTSNFYFFIGTEEEFKQYGRPMNHHAPHEINIGGQRLEDGSVVFSE